MDTPKTSSTGAADAKPVEAEKLDPAKLITDALIKAGFTVDISCSTGVHDIVYHVAVKR